MAEKLVYIDVSELEDVKKIMNDFPNEARAAMSNALNRTATKTVTFTHEEVSKKYAVKRVGIKKSLNIIRKASKGSLMAIVKSQDRRLKISHFPFSATGKNRIANVEIVRGRKVLSTSNPPLFVGRANATSGKREVFTRPDDKRYKVTYGFTLSIPQMIESEDVWDAIGEKSKDFLYNRFKHEWEQKLIRVSAKHGIKLN